MRPIKLVMQAFGPYATRQEVDFREALAAGLFGIYGPTGSGKSSIFNAITFALFGQAAKDEQSIGTMRSDHAGPDLPTQVEFIFQLSDKLYYVRRRPDQVRPKTSGEGVTKDQHSAWLFDATGLDIDTINQDRCGKALAEKKVGTVAVEIQRLLGYGPDQFRQIVLLPQGRFEAFLAAKSDDRVEILRNLFDVSLYRDLTEKMKAQARDAEQDVVKRRELCATLLRQQDCESDEALKTAIQEASDQFDQRVSDLARAQKLLSQANETYSNAKAIEERFVAHGVASGKLAAILSEGKAIERLRTRLDLAQVAQGLGDIHGELTEAESHLLAVQEAKATAERAKEEADERYQRAQAALTLDETRTAELVTLQSKRDAFARYAEILRGVKDMEADSRAKELSLEETSQALASLNRECEGLATEQNTARDTLKFANRSRVQRGKLEARLHAASLALDAARTYEDAALRLGIAANNLAEAKRLADEARAARKEAEKLCQLATGKLENARAHFLAKTLVAGEPCLVCGSPEHPAPARGDVDAIGLEEAAQSALLHHETASEAEGAAIEAAATVGGQVKELALMLEKLGTPPGESSVMSVKAEQIRSELADLGPEQNIPKIEAQIESLARRISTKTEARSNAEKSVSVAESAVAVAGNTLAMALRDVPETLRNAAQLATEQARLLEKIDERQRSSKAIQAEEKDASLAANLSGKDLENALKEMTRADAKVMHCSARFDDRLSEKSLTRAAYDIHRADINQIVTFKQAVTGHDSQLHQAYGSLKEAELAINGVDRPDLIALLENQKNSEQAAGSAADGSARARARLDLLAKLASDLANEFKEIDRLEESTGPMRALAAAFKGDNPMRTDLETYAIGAMFERVVESANERLVPMTSGQYRFERDSDTVSARSKRGLDIRIYDVHTGRTRDISTLSGGESFIAALSLALGLSDVVEMSSGNIRLDTIFIDEGFGSLDTDNDSGTLDRVLGVLQDMFSENRAVGLISHVPLVQQAIPNGFTIRKTPTGSSIEVRVG